MSFHTTNPIHVCARKRHLCSWCGEKIRDGETYMKWTCIDDDGPNTVKMHLECRAAERRFAQMESGQYEYDPYSFTRGCTCEAGDSGHGTYAQCIKADIKAAGR